MYFKALNHPSSEKIVSLRISLGKFLRNFSFERKLVDREG
jgi:hypothetical protein